MLSRFMTRREQFVLFFFGSAIIIGCAVYVWTHSEPDGARLVPAAPIETEAAPEPEPESDAAPPQEVAEDVVVSVQGAVRLPGVYAFNPKKRVMDAIKEAGGLGERADTSTINLAAHLVDGTTIVVPETDEEPAALSHATYLLRTGGAAGSSGAVANGTATSQRINVNTATQAELETLPGIGPAYARAIIQRRGQAPFRSVDELMEVRGIGEKRLEGIRDLVTVQ